MERGFEMSLFKKLFSKTTEVLQAPVAGYSVPLTQVPDPSFAEGLLGKGVAIEPREGKIYAPCNAVVDTMFETCHAVSLVADFGAEVLIHVGLETVKLKGQYFTVHCANGDKVRQGDLLIEFDLDAVQAAGYNTITSLLVCNSGDYGTFQVTTGKQVSPGDSIIQLAR